MREPIGVRVAKNRYLIIELVLFLILLYLLFCLYLKNDQRAAVNSEYEASSKICYLTFDDGPSRNTEKVLDILAEYDAKATFFLIGSELSDEMRPTLDRMIEEGHAIGLHSNVHKFEKIYASADFCLNDYEAEYKILKEKYGIETKLFRFPGGSTCSCMIDQREDYIQTMKENGYRCFDWNVSGEDSVGTPTVWSIQKNVFNDVFKYNESIVLLHDSKIADTTVDALPGILERIDAEGYSFETLKAKEEYIFRTKK